MTPTLTVREAGTATGAYDVDAVRRDFPILASLVHGKPLTFLDTAASAQKPRQVIDTIRHIYETSYANVHRGAYRMSEEVTEAYEAAREKVRGYLNAASATEIIFTKSATEALNLVAATHGRAHLKEGDEIVLTEAEHHSNIVPWQMLEMEKGVTLRPARIRDDGSLDMEHFRSLLGPRTRIVTVAHVSNVLGTIFPVREIARLAHEAGAVVVVDGCQGAVHGGVDVQAMGCDFYAFSGHKLYGPTGIGVLYGREKLLDAMPPYQGGGDMIETVSFAGTTWAPLPSKFEAGTPPIVQAIGLGAAVDYVTELGQDRIAGHEKALLGHAMEALGRVDGLRLIGTAPEKAAVLSFVLEGVHPHDLATYLDRHGIAVRAGHHCAQPLMERMGVTGTTRASLGLYSIPVEIDRLVAALEKARTFFG